MGLAVNGLQEGREMHTPRGKMQGKILSLRPSPLHKLRAGVVKGAVSVAVTALPAIGAQHAPAANLLGRPVKNHRRVLRRPGLLSPEKAVIEGPQSCRRPGIGRRRRLRRVFRPLPGGVEPRQDFFWQKCIDACPPLRTPTGSPAGHPPQRAAPVPR